MAFVYMHYVLIINITPGPETKENSGDGGQHNHPGSVINNNNRDHTHGGTTRQNTQVRGSFSIGIQLNSNGRGATPTGRFSGSSPGGVREGADTNRGTRINFQGDHNHTFSTSNNNQRTDQRHRHPFSISSRNTLHTHPVSIQSNNAPHSHPNNFSVDTDNAPHSHTIEQEGGDGAHENRPPFYALCYIIQAA